MCVCVWVLAFFDCVYEEDRAWSFAPLLHQNPIPQTPPSISPAPIWKGPCTAWLLPPPGFLRILPYESYQTSPFLLPSIKHVLAGSYTRKHRCKHTHTHSPSLSLSHSLNASASTAACIHESTKSLLDDRVRSRWQENVLLRPNNVHTPQMRLLLPVAANISQPHSVTWIAQSRNINMHRLIQRYKIASLITYCKFGWIFKDKRKEKIHLICHKADGETLNSLHGGDNSSVNYHSAQTD